MSIHYLQLGLLIITLSITNSAIAAPLVDEPIKPIPSSIKVDEKKVELGKKLFHDIRLSRNNNIACSNCHIISNAAVDNLRYSITNNGKPDLLNTPTIFNTAFNFRQTWRGAFKTLEQQAAADINNPRHSNIDFKTLVNKLNGIDEYVILFNEIYKTPISKSSITNSIAEYQRSLITPGARFDQYLLGDNNAITQDEKKGYELFKSYGCVACHQGINIGGNMFQKLGVMVDYFEEHKIKPKKPDFGRFNVTGKEEDRFVFKVPSLRNIALTAPYFHDGYLQTLEEAIEEMGHTQLGFDIPKKDIQLISKFLHTLTGNYRNKPLTSHGIPK